MSRISLRLKLMSPFPVGSSPLRIITLSLFLFGNCRGRLVGITPFYQFLSLPRSPHIPRLMLCLFLDSSSIDLRSGLVLDGVSFQFLLFFDEKDLDTNLSRTQADTFLLLFLGLVVIFSKRRSGPAILENSPPPKFLLFFPSCSC